MNLAEHLKNLRKAKGVSQEKLAEYLNVSYQAVSKWENGVTSPDISLLPEISRYFGITVDALLQAEQIDENEYFEECSHRAEELFRDGKREEIIPIWQEAYKKMPNNPAVKEMLMSTYFDTDKMKYQKEIIELGTDLYALQKDPITDSYYKGQAIEQIARTYYENGNVEKAKEWVQKAYSIMHSQEMMFMQIEDNEKWLMGDFRFVNFWYFDKLFYMAVRLNDVGVKQYGTEYVQDVLKTVAQLYETIYPGDDMGYETLRNLYNLHMLIAEDETSLGKDEEVVKRHLTRAVECAEKSTSIKAHELTHPLVRGWQVADSPADNTQMVRFLQGELMQEYYKPYREKAWFTELVKKLEKLIG
ncbi:MAG: helix-turn-helix transcriptional regulator [Clostridia bacterium]|nr:helix-turn-helix transcriptional regulator [Clostridia bacterium]